MPKEDKDKRQRQKKKNAKGKENAINLGSRLVW
jgi:hypothetical protein